KIERNGVGIGTSPGTATEFIDASPVGLDSVYRVVVLADGADIKSTNDCFLPCSAHALSCGLALQGGVTQGTLSWTPISDGPGILTFVFRNGALLKSLQKGETAFLDPDVESRNPLSAVEYRVVESAPEIG